MTGFRALLWLVLAFAAAALVTAGIGGATGVFDRGPSEEAVTEAEERGAEDARSLIDVRMAPRGDEEEEAGYQRGRESNEWLSLDRLPNPDGWFAGVMAGRAERERAIEEAHAAGYADGELQGRDEAVGALRDADDGEN